MLKCSCIMLLFVANGLCAEVIRVPEDVSNVQFAINRASEGDIISIAHGVYEGGVDLQGKAVTLRGRDGAEFTSLRGGAGVIRCGRLEGPSTIIEGLTIAGGTGVVGNDGVRRGGGSAHRWCESSDSALHHCGKHR